MEGVLYDGAGNLFLMFDGRGIINLEVAFPSERVVSLCSAVPDTVPDGLIVLLDPTAEGCDFSMHYFNRDGSGGSMCGNGGRCIAAFARDLGIRPASEDGIYRFIAAGKPYSAEILEDSGATKVVRLSLPDVEDAENLPDPAGWYLDTGCPHFVSFLKDAEALETLDIAPAALPLRHHKVFPYGVNVDFIAPLAKDSFAIRTFERGVEAETLACGTGVVASAISAALALGLAGPLHLGFKALGGNLSVDLTVPDECKSGTPVATDIYLTGPTRRH